MLPQGGSTQAFTTDGRRGTGGKVKGQDNSKAHWPTLAIDRSQSCHMVLITPDSMRQIVGISRSFSGK